jgi:hypothetical protein
VLPFSAFDSVASISNSTLPPIVKPLSVLFEKTIAISLSVVKLSPSVVATPEDVDLY